MRVFLGFDPLTIRLGRRKRRLFMLQTQKLVGILEFRRQIQGVRPVGRDFEDPARSDRKVNRTDSGWLILSFRGQRPANGCGLFREGKFYLQILRTLVLERQSEFVSGCGLLNV